MLWWTLAFKYVISCRKKVHLFLFKMILWIFFDGAWNSGWFLQKWLVIMDLYRSTHTSVLVPMGTEDDTSLRGIMGAIKGDFLDAKQACPFGVQIPTSDLIRTQSSSDWINQPRKWTIRVSYCHSLRLCKTSNKLVKFSQNSLKARTNQLLSICLFLGSVRLATPQRFNFI